MCNRINRRAGTTVYWRCFFRWCRANAVVENGRLKSVAGKHICQQPLAAKGRPAMPPSVSQSATAAVKKTQTAAAAQKRGNSDQNGSKMATRGAQTNGRKAGKGPNKGQKSTTTNNNLVVRRKSRQEDDSKATANGHNEEAHVNIEDDEPSPDKQVCLLSMSLSIRSIRINLF